MSSMSEGEEPTIERRREGLQAALVTYSDARGRSTVISAAALTALGVLSLLIGFAGPQRLYGMGVWALPALALIGVGLVCALTVLLRTPVSVPFVMAAFADEGFLGAKHDEVLGNMLASVIAAEASTRRANGRAAVLVNLGISAFVAAGLLLAFQVGIDAKGGLGVGVSAAVIIVGLAWLLRNLMFIRGNQGASHA
jgi:hypothetical protein